MQTTKQQQEIDFLCVNWKVKPTKKEIEEYFDCTVHGKKDLGEKRSTNSLFQAKRSLDMMIKMWTRDLANGLFSCEELLEGFNNHPYFKKVLRSIMKRVIKDKIYDTKEGVFPIAMWNRGFYYEKLCPKKVNNGANTMEYFDDITAEEQNQLAKKFLRLCDDVSNGKIPYKGIPKKYKTKLEKAKYAISTYHDDVEFWRNWKI